MDAKDRADNRRDVLGYLRSGKRDTDGMYQIYNPMWTETLAEWEAKTPEQRASEQAEYAKKEAESVARAKAEREASLAQAERTRREREAERLQRERGAERLQREREAAERQQAAAPVSEKTNAWWIVGGAILLLILVLVIVAIVYLFSCPKGKTASGLCCISRLLSSSHC